MMNCGGFGKDKMPDMEETKEHILAAGRELMLAADGALRFCKAYATQVKSPKPRSQLEAFFSKAIAVADELAKGLITASGKEAAKKAAAPLFEALGREMVKESRSKGGSRAKRAAGRKDSAAKKKAPAGRKKAVGKAGGRTKSRKRS